MAGYLRKAGHQLGRREGPNHFPLCLVAKRTVVENDSDISANATGEVIVDITGATPFIEEVRFTPTKPTRVKLVAKIGRFETMTRYRLMPGGKRFRSN